MAQPRVDAGVYEVPLYFDVRRVHRDTEDKSKNRFQKMRRILIRKNNCVYGWSRIINRK